MMRNQRSSFTPVALLLGFEIAAILALQALGGTSSMQVPWGSFASWINAGPIENIVPPLVRVLALAVAYWMFLSTALFVVAQISRIPAAVRATSMFTLPSVRRVVDGAMVVSIATTSVMGVGATAAMAATPDATTTSNSLTMAQITVDGSTGGVATPNPGSVTTVTEEEAADAADDSADDSGDDESADDSADDESGDDESADDSSDDSEDEESDDTTTSTAAPTTTSTAAPTTTGAPSTPTTGSLGQAGTVTIIGSGDAGSVATPRPGAPLATTSVAPTTAAPNSNTWVVPTTGFSVATPKPVASAATTPTTAAPETSADGTQVLGVQEHRVVQGENLWTIARDAVAQSNGGTAPTESQVRDYWLKVIDANKGNLRSGDPHWIFAGEVVTLP